VSHEVCLVTTNWLEPLKLNRGLEGCNGA